jgi:predicted kinase
MPKLYVLVGVPASGKTTWFRGQEWADPCYYISTDKHVEAYAEAHGRTYSEVFTDYMPTAVENMVEEVIRARDAGIDIVWDQTSTTVASRRRKFDMLPDYYKIAVVFETPPRVELRRRLDSRPGKEIPDAVVEGMLASFEMPTEQEGFDEIWYTNQKNNLINI